MSKSERNIFNMLWDMFNEINDADTYRGRSQTGAIISRYAGVLDDRIKNSGNSRSVLSLKLYTTEQLQEEIESREV